MLNIVVFMYAAYTLRRSTKWMKSGRETFKEIMIVLIVMIALKLLPVAVKLILSKRLS